MDPRPTMSTLLSRCSVLLLALGALGGQPKSYTPKEDKVPGPEVKQPIAYSHKTHVAMGLKCIGCHAMPGDGFQASYPKETVCMGCHTGIKKESPEIQKLAAFAAKKEPVPWARVYQVPDMVWFNHALHVKDAQIACAGCHGDVAQRPVLFKEKATSMKVCMQCHAERMAPNGCDTCHPSQ